MTNTTQKTTARRIALLSTLPLLGALSLAGCSSDDDGDDRAGGTVPSVAASSSAGSSAGTSTGTSTGTAADGSLADAAATARDAVGSGSVLSIEQEAGGTSWEVVVADADGSEQEVHVDATGSDVTAGPTAESSDPDDRAENTRFLDAAELTVADAASKLTDTVDGNVTELGLDDHMGTVVWEGDVVDADGTTHGIRIDAGSGAVVTNAVDTDTDD